MKVKFMPQDQEFEIDSNESILEVAKRNGIFIKFLCNGQASCAECRVRVIEGEHNVISPSAKEISQIGSMYYVDNRRLSCQLKCFGDVVIDTSDHIGKEGTTVKKARGAKESSSAVTGQLFTPRSAVDEDEKKANELVLKQERDQILRKIKAEKKNHEKGFYGDLKSGVDYREYDADSGKRKRSKKRNNFSLDEDEKELDLSQVDENQDLDLTGNDGKKKKHRNNNRRRHQNKKTHNKSNKKPSE